MIAFTIPGVTVAKGRARTLKSGRSYTPAKTANYVTDANIADWDALEMLKPKPKRRIGKARAGSPLESPIQREIVKALRKLGVIVHHSPNGANLPGDALAKAKQSAKLVADGMMPGWPDLTLINRQGNLGLMEVKREGGVVSADQEKVSELAQSRGVPVAFVCTLDEALAAVSSWGWI